MFEMNQGNIYIKSIDNQINYQWILFVPEVGIEPTLPKEHDFESCASTSSATRANGLKSGKYTHPPLFKQPEDIITICIQH
jgi:hypothetical protein